MHMFGRGVTVVPSLLRLPSDGHQVHSPVGCSSCALISCAQLPFWNEFGMSVGISHQGFLSLVALQIMMGNDALLSSLYRTRSLITTPALPGRITPTTYKFPSIPKKQLENLVASFLDSLQRPAPTIKRYTRVKSGFQISVFQDRITIRQFVRLFPHSLRCVHFATSLAHNVLLWFC